MKKHLPLFFAVLGLGFLAVALSPQFGAEQSEALILLITRTIMLVSGAICLVVGLVTFLVRDDPDVW